MAKESSSSSLLSFTLLLLVVMTKFHPCHARLLNGCILDNAGSAASDPTLNGAALPLPVIGSGSEQRVPLLEDGSRDGAASSKGKYRTLVLNVLPKGTKRPPSGPSKRHNDFNS